MGKESGGQSREPHSCFMWKKLPIIRGRVAKKHQHRAQVATCLQCMSNGDGDDGISVYKISKSVMQSPTKMIDLIRHLPEDKGQDVVQSRPVVTSGAISASVASPTTILTTTTIPSIPFDRLSVVTYWWGFDIFIPSPEAQKFLALDATVQQIADGIGIVAQGPFIALLPFIRLIAGWFRMNSEQIRRSDRGNGVVCSAVWACPVMLIVRSWDGVAPNGFMPPLEVTGELLRMVQERQERVQENKHVVSVGIV